MRSFWKVESVGAEDNLQKIEVEIRHEKKYSNLYITI